MQTGRRKRERVWEGQEDGSRNGYSKREGRVRKNEAEERVRE